MVTTTPKASEFINPNLLAMSDGAERQPFSKGWWLFALLLFIEFGLFRQYAINEVVWAYPQNFDQFTYLNLSYEIYEVIKEKGLIFGVKYGLKAQCESGMMLPVQASLLYLVGGPSRLTALSLNFLYFALLQTAMAGTFLWLTRRWSIALLGVGLLLTTLFPFGPAGGLMDFRIDFISYCLYGTFLCVLVRSGAFASRGWTLVVGATAALCITFRYISATYFVGVTGSLFVLFCAQAVLTRDRERRQAALSRLANLLVAGGLIIVTTAPVLYYHRKGIENHYINHLSSGEAEVRQREFGYVSRPQRLMYYPNLLIEAQLGKRFLSVAGGGIACAALVGLMLLLRRRRDSASPKPNLGVPFLLTMACIAVPMAILTTYSSPSPLVGAVVAPCLVFGVVLGIAVFTGAGRNRLPIYASRAIGILAFVSLSFGLEVQTDRLSRRSALSAMRADAEQVNSLYDVIASHSIESNWKAPRVAVNEILDYMNTGNIKSLGYERHGKVIEAYPQMGNSVMESPTETEAIALFRKSEFVMLTTNEPPNGPGEYPFNKTMAVLRPALLAFAENNLIRLGKYHMFGRDISLYMRPTMNLSGDAGGWILSDGLDLTGTAETLHSFPVVELNGKAAYEALGKVPKISARLQIGESTPIALKPVWTAGADTYSIRIEIDPSILPAKGPVRVHVDFDAYFVPKDKGINSDTRKLVVFAPQVSLHRPNGAHALAPSSNR